MGCKMVRFDFLCVFSRQRYRLYFVSSDSLDWLQTVKYTTTWAYKYNWKQPYLALFCFVSCCSCCRGIVDHCFYAWWSNFDSTEFGVRDVHDARISNADIFISFSIYFTFTNSITSIDLYVVSRQLGNVFCTIGRSKTKRFIFVLPFECERLVCLVDVSHFPLAFSFFIVRRHKLKL